jgi:xylulokinase
VLGIDVSTTGSKALLVDADGTVVGSASTPHTLSTPRPLWSEQDPAEWWRATAASIRSALVAVPGAASRVVGVGLTGQMHGLVALDAAGSILRPAILWNDQRTAAECDEIRDLVGRERLIHLAGNDALPGFTAPKLLWVRHHEPEISARIAHVLLPKDYVRLRLTGDYAMDKADGSGTLLFDLAARDWSTEVCDALSIPRAWLPPTFEGPLVTGTVTQGAADETGLPAGTPVVAGGGDQAAGAVGMGIVRPGLVSVTLGTSGVVFAATDAPLIEPQGRLHAFCHAVPDRWHVMGVTLAAAGSLQWYRDTLAPGIGFDVLLDEAVEAPAGCDGLLFLPYLSGERTPYPDPLARGAFVGLTMRHRRAHVTRAVLEGVAYSMHDCFSLMAGVGVTGVTEASLSGGGARGALWRQILADVLGVAMVAAAADEGAAYGAALLAGVGSGFWADVDAACAAIPTGVRTEPNGANAEIYAERYEQYRALYPALTPAFRALGEQ